MFSPSIRSFDGTTGIRYVVTNSANRNSHQPSASVGRKDRSVTFAKPLVSDVLEIDAHIALEGLSSPILAGHSSIYPSLNGPAICRICYSGENSGPKEGEPLISPCHCKGTMGLYHRTCLNKWLAASNKTCCEICQFKFQIRRVGRTFWEYIRDDDFRTAKRNMLTDILCFFLLTPLVLISTIACCLSALHLINEHSTTQRNIQGLVSGLHVEIAIGLLFLSAVLLVAYCVWLGVTVTFHHRSFLRWQSTHWHYTVVDQLSMEESMLINSFGA